jgi:hypothetical protein
MRLTCDFISEMLTAKLVKDVGADAWLEDAFGLLNEMI